MANKRGTNGMLSPYRVLDLTDEKGLLCGKLFGDLGADVIKIERPGGDPARNIGPFYHDEADPEKSLFWFAFNTNKRGITLDIETADGRELLKRLIKRADFTIESFPRGYMDKLGLGYTTLEKLNPGIIMVSIAPFGQTGPYRDYKTSDIVAWAMGGFMYPSGDADRPPSQISHHSQVYLHAGAQGAVGAMMALYHRAITGEGQYVDVSIHESGSWLDCVGIGFWGVMKTFHQRNHNLESEVMLPRMWPCKDGYVTFVYFGGPLAERMTIPLIKWMESEGMADDFIKGIDWNTFNLRTVTQEMVFHVKESTNKFFMAYTAAELYEGALKHGVQLYPVSTTKDILNSVQLAAREYWVELEHPELGITINYPGAFLYASETPPQLWHRAPLIGEHNRQVYEEELGLSREELVILKQAKVI